MPALAREFEFALAEAPLLVALGLAALGLALVPGVRGERWGFGQLGILAFSLTTMRRRYRDTAQLDYPRIPEDPDD